MDSINKTDMVLLDKEISNEAESELGPLRYLAETTGYPMNKVVNWFLLLIIFVFDPLAIALVIAANMAFAQLKSNTEVKMSVPDGMEFNKPYSIEDRDLVVDDLETDVNLKTKEIGLDAWINVLEEEERMNIIGQNGNDGLHYDQEKMIKKNEELLATPKKDIYDEKEKIKKSKENNPRNTQHYG